MEKPSNKPSPNEDEANPLDYLIVPAKHSRLIIYTSAVVTILTYLILVILPNTYQSTTRLLSPQQNLTMSAQLLESLGGGGIPKFGGGAGGMATLGIPGLKSPGDFYVSLMTGETVVRRVIQRFDLVKVYRAKNLEKAVAACRERVTFKVGPKDGLISIETTDTDPKRAADIVNAFPEELDSLLTNLALQEAKSRLIFLEKELAQASLNLTKAEEALKIFSEQNSVVQLDTQTRGTLEYIGKLRAEIDTKEVQIKVMRQQATPNNYDVIRLETELNGLKENLRAADCTLDQSTGLNVCLTTSKAPGLGLEYMRLFRESKFQDGLYQLYSKMVEIARLDMAKNVTVVQVVDKAVPAEERANRRAKPALIVGLVTFFLMICVSFGLENLPQYKEKEASRLQILAKYLKPWLGFLRRKRG
jgi:tyrosine-protein kinase Etk/Wzc